MLRSMFKGKAMGAAGAVIVLALIAAGSATIALAGSDAEPPDSTAATTATPDEFAPAAQGRCRPNRVQFRTEPFQRQIDSTSYVNVPGTGFPFSHGGAGQACVVVVFSGEVAPLTPDSAPIEQQNTRLRARIPGVGDSDTEVFLGRHPEGSFFRTYSVQFVFPAVPPGNHAIRILGRSVLEGMIAFRNMVVTVHHRAD